MHKNLFSIQSHTSVPTAWIRKKIPHIYLLEHDDCGGEISTIYEQKVLHDSFVMVKQCSQQ